MRLLPPALCFLLILFGSCANMVPPSGGKKDITPPKLISVTPKDSSLGIKPRVITLEFDEYIQLSDAATQVQLSPLLPIPLTVTNTPRRVVIHIPDTLLQDATTYRLTFGHAISDLHEGNPWAGGSYTFSTGTFFDTLRLEGNVISGPTGLPDTAATVVLYSGTESDSAIVRHKPLYVAHTDGTGRFSFGGLPPRPFRLYALHDANNNLIFDGGQEWIAFEPAVFTPRADSVLHYTLHSFQERNTDTTAKKQPPGAFGRNSAIAVSPAITVPYLVNVDTSDTRRRTQEINKPLNIFFQRKVSAFNPGKIFLAFDSTGIIVEAPTTTTLDTSGKIATISTPWHDNSLYTLRLQKGFAKDSAGNDLFPGRYTFRTKRDEDYGTLRINIPTKYYGSGYVLQVTSESDTVYQKPITDTAVRLRYLPPSKYTFRIIVDQNQNGRWDPGDLFAKKQPEIVIPYNTSIMLKAGWDNLIDFEAPDRKKTTPTNTR